MKSFVRAAPFRLPEPFFLHRRRRFGGLAQGGGSCWFIAGVWSDGEAKEVAPFRREWDDDLLGGSVADDGIAVVNEGIFEITLFDLIMKSGGRREV